MEKELSQEISSAKIDYLTGELNRRGLYEFFSHIPEDTDVNFMFLDIDNFKGVNDTYGHAMGDKLLVEVAKTIKSRIGDSLLARIGGDEFVVMPSSELLERAVIGMAESILNSVNSIDISLEIRSIISFSIGIVMHQKKSQGLDNIMPKCDAAMYEAKRRGKNGYVLYSTIEDLFELKQIVDREKNKALQNGEFEVRYIPVMNITSSELMAAKAYVVWNRNNGIWREEMFKSIFEENGFILELEKYELTNIFKMIAETEKSGLHTLPVIFTISEININRIGFAEELLKKSKAMGVEPGSLVIQLDHVNERMDARRVIYFFKNLKELGFGTAFKGFGSSGESLQLIKNLSLDYVSVGKDIVDNMLNDKRESLFVKNILSLINDMNYEAIMEGISNAMQIRYLTAYGCNLGSGTMFSEDLSEEAYRAFVEKNTLAERKCIEFEFKNNLNDVTQDYTGVYLGNGKEQYVYDDILKKEVLYLPGGSTFQSVVEFPAEIMETASYSVVLRFRANNFHNWTSLLYVSYEDGFMSFMPYAWSGLSMYRIKGDIRDDVWYDSIGNKIDKEWHTVVITYNHKSSIAKLYTDGKFVAIRDNVILLDRPKRLVLGGDIYADSFEGFVDSLTFYDYVLDQKEIEKMYEQQI